MAKNMDIRFLTTFLEVSKTRHFGKAAENLYLTQSAISARIKLLEEYFNTSLFIRHRNSIQLTSAGEKLIPFAESMSATLAQAKLALNEMDVSYLVCGATPNACELFLNESLIQMNSNFPALSLRAEMLNTEQLSRQLHERTIDIAFTTEPLKSDDTENIAIHNTNLRMYSASPKLDENTFDDYVHIEWSNKISEVLYQLYPATKRAVFKTSSLNIATHYVDSKGGSVLLPENTAQNIHANLPLKEVTEIEPFNINTYLVHLKDIKNSALAEFIQFYQSQSFAPLTSTD